MISSFLSVKYNHQKKKCIVKNQKKILPILNFAQNRISIVACYALKLKIITRTDGMMNQIVCNRYYLNNIRN